MAAEDDQIQSAMNYLKEMRGSLPQWYCIALDATQTIAKMDAEKGLECASALYVAAQRAPDDIKVAALTKLIELLRTDGGGFNVPSFLKGSGGM